MARAVHDIETLIVGAGVVGLAIARELTKAGYEVVMLEKHGIIGSETSARNSEVIHAGIYYLKGSLKAQTCVEGKRLLYDFCQSHGVPHKPVGKLIVAASEDQKQMLEGIKRHAFENGVDDLRSLDQSALKQMEPELYGVAALFSPSTGIIDSHAYMLALQGDAEAHGCQIAFNTEAISWRQLSPGGFEVKCCGIEDTTLTTRNLVVCGGLHASRFLNATEVISAPTTYFAKGNYFRLIGKAPFSHLIYPVPEPGGLGIHLTLDMGAQARFGPDVEWVDDLEYEMDVARSQKFYAAIRSYWPDLPDDALELDYAGIRPKLSGPGQPNEDFLIWGPKYHGRAGLIGLLGIESPGLTASMAIAKHVNRMLH